MRSFITYGSGYNGIINIDDRYFLYQEERNEGYGMACFPSWYKVTVITSEAFNNFKEIIKSGIELKLNSFSAEGKSYLVQAKKMPYKDTQVELINNLYLI